MTNTIMEKALDEVCKQLASRIIIECAFNEGKAKENQIETYDISFLQLKDEYNSYIIALNEDRMLSKAMVDANFSEESMRKNKESRTKRYNAFNNLEKQVADGIKNLALETTLR